MDTKLCRGCNERKPLGAFSKLRRRGKETVQSRCKECQSSRYAVWMKSEKGQKYLRERNADPAEKARKLTYSRTEEGKARMKAYRQTEAGKIARKRDLGKRLSTPEGRWKHYIRGCLNDAIRYGKIVKPDHCSRCGEKAEVQGHHHSYAYEHRFDVRWLCSQCHSDEHDEEAV